MHTILFVRRAARVAAFMAWTAAATSLGLQAQQTGAPDLRATLNLPINPFTSVAADTSSSSSSSAAGDTTDAVAAERLSLSSTSDNLQPPPRRRYGRPRYTDSSHNADGSNKYVFEVGAGLTLPTGDTHKVLSTSYSFQGGIGRNFNKKEGVIAQFDWDNFGVQTNTLNSLLATYNNLGYTDQNNAPLSQLNGSSHVWSFTLNPIYNFYEGDKTGAYVIAGAGFYHKTASFSVPVIGTGYDPYYGYYQYQANAPIDTYTSNAFGVNGGIGFTYKPSQFANERLFVEARYVYNFNSRRPYYDGTTGTSLSSTYFNVFPQNSAPTSYIPIKFGVRF